jgi:glycosyltransferase involved in cell wall biosynthesis
VISEALKGEVASRGIDLDKVVLVPNGVDVRAFEPGPAPESLRNALGLEQAITIGYIGSFFYYEGLDLLVEGVKLLVDDFPNLRLLLVGDGELMPVLKKQAEDPRLTDRIIFVGRVPHEKVSDYYRLSDIFVLPRRLTRETRLVTPLKPLEIMAMGKPLAASDIGGHRELIQEGVGAMFFESENVADLATRCRELVANPDLRRDMGIRARKWVEQNRDWNVLVNRYVELYQKLTKEKKNRSGK